MEPILNPESNSAEAAAMENSAEASPEEAATPVAAEQETATAGQPAASEASPNEAEDGADGAPEDQSVVINRLDRFEAQLTEHLRQSASCSRAAFDHLYEEMQAYKKNFLREAQRPLLLDLMMLYDSIDKLRRNYEQTPSVEPATLCQNLDTLQVEAEEILGRVGIERMTATSGKLDVNLQRAVKTIPTDNPEEHLLVVEQISSGFISGAQPLRKEQVVVKKYTPRTPDAGETNADARETTTPPTAAPTSDPPASTE